YVAQQLTAGAVHELAKELDFVHRGRAEADVARRILHEVRPSQTILHLVEMLRDQPQGFLVIRKRQQVVEIFALMCRPGQMTRNKNRIDLVDERTNALQMSTIDPAGAADRYADGMYRNRIMPTRIEQELGRVWVGKKILRMNLKPARSRQGGHDLR